MIDLEKMAQHKVYRTELISDTLIVTLQGDAPGFSFAAVHNEMATVAGLFIEPGIRNLIIDMSGSNYYGSLILGEIVNLGQKVRITGGRIALAGLSNDMKEVLRIMRLDGMWERYATREKALRALADRIPWSYRIKPFVVPVASMAAAALLLAVILWFPRPNPAPYNYSVVRKLWDEAEDLRRVDAGEAEWNMFLAKAKPRLAEVADRLKNSHNNEAARSLIYVSRDYAPGAFEQHLDPAEFHTIAADYYLKLCQAYLTHTRPPFAPPEVTGAPAAGVGLPSAIPPGDRSPSVAPPVSDESAN